MIVLTDPDKKVRGAIAEFIAGEADGGNGVVQVEAPAKLDKILADRSAEVDVILIGPGVEAQTALNLAAAVQEKAPEISVIFLAKTLDPTILRAAIRYGVKDVLAEPFSKQQLQEAVQRAQGLARSLRGRSSAVTSAADISHHKAVTVFSWKGGCGKSFMASNLAVLLAQKTAQEVALVDLDLQSGDLAIMLQLSPKWTMYDAAERLEGLDTEELRGYMTRHSSGVKVLAAPFEPQLAETISGGAVQRILRILRDSFPYVVVDGPASLNEHVLAALDESDDCILMCSLDVPSIKNVKVSLQTLEQLGIGRNRIRLVMNRADSKVGLNLSEVEKSLGTHIDIAVPSSRDVPLSVNQGVPLAIHNRRSPVIGAVAKLADMLVEDSVKASREKKALWGGR